MIAPPCYCLTFIIFSNTISYDHGLHNMHLLLKRFLRLMNTVLLLLKCFFKAGESVIATLRDFCAHFMLCQNDAVPVRKSILL